MSRNQDRKNIPLITPYITDSLKQRVMDVLDSGYLTEGPVTAEFEESIANYCGVSHAIAVTSCTTGLEMALRCLDVGPGDEVIVPDYTYPATASVVNIVGATAVIVDVNPETMLVDYDALVEAITKHTKAVIPVSLFGNPLDWERLDRIRDSHGLKIIEDAACSLGAAHNGRKVGTFADITVFSFHPRKFITTGEGGMATTNHEHLAEWMQSYKHFGIGTQIFRSAVSFQRMGTNYKLSDVLAAIGLAQMEEIDSLLSRRKDLAARYDELLGDVKGVELPETTPGGEHSYQSYCVMVPYRDQIMEGMKKAGIEVQIGTYALHLQPAFQDSALCRLQGPMQGSQYAFYHTLALPLFHDMDDREQERVVDVLRGLLCA